MGFQISECRINRTATQYTERIGNCSQSAITSQVPWSAARVGFQVNCEAEQKVVAASGSHSYLEATAASASGYNPSKQS